MLEFAQDEYRIGGVSALSLSEKYGTPLYVYDAKKMEKQYKQLCKAFSKTKMKVHYACKALTNISVLKFFKSLGAGLDTVSIEEVQLGLLAGFEPSDILFTPNSVSLQEINEAVELGVQVNIDSISVLEEFGHKWGGKIPVCIRINPHLMAGGNAKISVGHIDSKFGISLYQMRHVLRIVDAYKMKITGLHMHTGSDILDVEVFLRGLDILLETAEDFPDLEYIDMGSGFKVAYKENDITTNIEKLGEQVSERFNQFCTEYGRELTLVFEPGKFLVSEAGTFLASVNVIKTTPTAVFVGLNSGMNHLIRPMFYDAYHHIVNISNPTGISRVYNVVGYICETDTFGANRKLSEVRENDVLAFKNAGAYSFMMSSNYNSRFRPAEVLIYEGKDYLIRKRETLEDITKNQIEMDFKNISIEQEIIS
ncbi:diaminopimelate decarboxylase [Bernardetia sp.]|uniref:diaminopimelate decarboxylase n=1 Tax=Bernardetia sp. TaxID=1937974 RepID=UPI0025BB843E|nr:diaminopimelate decarboxylase [Bernardetia sp.]